MDFQIIHTRAHSKEEHLNSPSLGAMVAEEDRHLLKPEGKTVQLLVSEGLSADAIHANLPSLLPVLWDGLTGKGYALGKPLLARYGRVKLAEEVARATECRVVILLIGERPGGDAAAATSLSAYFLYSPPKGPFEYTVLSNIYSRGIPPLEAASLIVEKTAEILHHGAAGNRLEAIRKA